MEKALTVAVRYNTKNFGAKAVTFPLTVPNLFKAAEESQWAEPTVTLEFGSEVLHTFSGQELFELRTPRLKLAIAREIVASVRGPVRRRA